VNTFVAAFIGAPTMNLYAGKLDAVGPEGATLHLGSQSIRVPASVFSERPGLAARAGGRVFAGIRPEDLHDPALRPGAPPDDRLRSEVDLVEALGSDLLVHFGLDAEQVAIRSSDSLQQISADEGEASRCIARLTPKSKVKVGAPIEVEVDTSRLHFFDDETGEAIFS
jgi:multiple sugar transport system ATP-binding protein